MSKRIIANYIYLFYILFSLISFLYCLKNEQYVHEAKPVYVLPLCYSILLILFRGIRNVFLSLSYIIVNSVCLIRFSVYPFFVVHERFSYFSNEAIYLMSYELIVVMIILHLYKFRVHKYETMDIREDVSNKYKLGYLNTILSLSIFPLIILYPSLLSIFSLLGWGGERIPISGLISILFQIGTMIGYIYMLSMLGGKKKGGLWALWLSVLIACGYIFFTSVGHTSVSRWNFLWVGIPTTYILIASYPRYKKRILFYALMLIPFAIFLGSFVKFAISNVSIGGFVSKFLDSDTLDAYFGGLSGVSDALMILRGNGFAESWTCTLTDFLGNMPVISQFFDAENLSTEAIYLDALGRTDLICPLLAQSVIHFGIIGAPIMSALMCIIAIESDIAANKAADVYTIYGFRMQCVVFSLFMCLNTTIILPKLWILSIYLIIQSVNNKIFINGKTVNSRSCIQYS